MIGHTVEEISLWLFDHLECFIVVSATNLYSKTFVIK